MLKIIQKTKNRIVKYIKGFVSNTILFYHFMIELDYKTYRQWSLSDDKKIYVKFIEWLFNEPMKYIFIGLFLSLALTIDSIWLKCTVGYWLIFRLLWLVRNKE